MRVNVKMMNGDLITMEMETYSEKTVRTHLSSYSSDPVKIIDIDEDEDQEQDEKKEEKNVMVVFLPVHKRGKEFVTMLNQYVTYSYEPHDLIDGSLSKKWLEECQNCAHEQGYKSFIEKKSDLSYYFNQLPLFLSYSDNDENICGDTYVTAGETALQVFTYVMMACHQEVVQNPICLNAYKQLCKTSSSQSLTNIASHLYDNFRCLGGDIEDVLSENSFMMRGKLLQIIHSVNPLSIFDTIDEVSSNELISTFSSLSRLTRTKVLGVLKYYMNIM